MTTGDDRRAVWSARRARASELLFGPWPISQLARTHGLITAADAFFVVSLAGSLFFSVSVDAARPRVMLYLALTMAPFVVLGPLIGPFIDRIPGGHRVVVALTCLGRMAVAVALAANLRTLVFYPLAFAMLVLGKTYSVAKNALVPRLVSDPADLIDTNARLSRLASITGLAGAGIAAMVFNLADAALVLRIGAAVHLAALVASLRIARPSHAQPLSRSLEYAELHAPRLVMAAGAMSVLRGATGFLLFLLGFALKRGGEPAWFFGSVFAVSGIGGFAGTYLAGRARRLLDEERILASALGLTAAVLLVAAGGYGRATIVAAAFATGLSANVGRSAFDSLVQHWAPDADRGRTFARFETQFQLAWIVGAFIPVALRPPAWIGLLLLGLLLSSGTVAYLLLRGPAETVTTTPPDTGDLAAALLATARRALAEGSYREAVVHAGSSVQVGIRSASAVPEQIAELERLREKVVAGKAVSEDEARRALDIANALLAGR